MHGIIRGMFKVPRFPITGQLLTKSAKAKVSEDRQKVAELQMQTANSVKNLKPPK